MATGGPTAEEPERNFVPDSPEFEHLDRYEKRRLQELMLAIDKSHHNTGKLDGVEAEGLTALTREFRNAEGTKTSFVGSSHLNKFSADLASVKKTDVFGFCHILDDLRRKSGLTPLVFPHERESLLELYRAVDTDVVGDGLDANELDKLSTGIIKIGEYLRAKMDGMDDNPNVSEEEWLEYFGRERSDPEWLNKINQYRAKMDLPPLEESYTDCYVVIGDEDVEPMAGTYHHEHGTVPVDSHRLFVCFTHSFGKEPICDFAIMEGSTDEASPPAGFEIVDANLGTRNAPKYLCVKPGMPAISHVEVCYGTDVDMNGYHCLTLNPHGVDGEVRLRWLLDGEDVPQVLTESEIQQREIQKQLEVRKELQAQREKDLHRVYAAIDKAQETNHGLQMQIAAFVAPAAAEGEDENHPSESQRRFAKLVQQWIAAKLELERLRKTYNATAVDLQKSLDDREAKAGEIQESFDDFKREIIKAAENSRTGKKIPLKLIEQFEADGRQKNEEVERMRITDIKLRMTLRKLNKQLKQKEELQEGVHLIDFEQLKIENQTLNEKIEERNEELQKFRKKTTKTVQELTHLKEKVYFHHAENQVWQAELDELDAEMAKERGTLTKAKGLRERLRAQASSLKNQRGFGSNPMLVQDFERRKRTMDEMRDQIASLKQRLHSLTLK